MKGGLPKRYVHVLELVNVTLFCNKVVTDIMKLRLSRLDHSGLFRWALNSITNVFVRDKRRRYRVGDYVKMGAAIAVTQP